MIKDRVYLVGRLLILWLGVMIGLVVTKVYIHKLNVLNQEIDFRIPFAVAMLACMVVYFVFLFLANIAIKIIEHYVTKHKKSILLVTDVKKSRIMGSWLELNGYKVTMVSLLEDKEVITRLLRSESFNICVLDLAYKGHFNRASNLGEEVDSRMPIILLTFEEGYQPELFDEIFDRIIIKKNAKEHAVLIETIAHFLSDDEEKDQER